VQKGVVRIIGGKWRGRRLKVPAVPGLRPTPDRVRETVFNWLSMYLPGARCLDAFAGSGAFGFEALSRGAAYVEMVDQSQTVMQVLKEELAQFQVDNANIYCASLPLQLQKPDQPFDIVFLDPPYQANLLYTCCHYLEEHDFLADLAHLYLEAHTAVSENELPANWRLLKAKSAGQVYYHLVIREKT
jgi:16S rRNA (guanine966-N2)-methyltransferase